MAILHGAALVLDLVACEFWGFNDADVEDSGLTGYHAEQKGYRFPF